jgi:hypothetical protein
MSFGIEIRKFAMASAVWGFAMAAVALYQGLHLAPSAIQVAEATVVTAQHDASLR